MVDPDDQIVRRLDEIVHLGVTAEIMRPDDPGPLGASQPVGLEVTRSNASGLDSSGAADAETRGVGKVALQRQGQAPEKSSVRR